MSAFAPRNSGHSVIGDGPYSGEKPHVVADQDDGEDGSEVPEVLARQSRPQQGFHKVVQSLKEVFHRILEPGRQNAPWRGWRTIRPPYQQNRQKEHQHGVGHRQFNAAWKRNGEQVGGGLLQSVLRSFLRRTRAAAHHAGHRQRRQPQELEKSAHRLSFTIIVPTPVNTGKGKPFPLFDGFDCVLSPPPWQAQNLARTQIIYICI